MLRAISFWDKLGDRHAAGVFGGGVLSAKVG